MSRFIDSDRIGYGRNFDQGARKDNRYVRCSRCGFICHLDRDERSYEGSRQGWGVSLVTDITFDDSRVAVDSSNLTSSTVTLQNVHTDGYFLGGRSPSITKNSTQLVSMYGEGTSRETVSQGCPFCGTLMYNK